MLPKTQRSLLIIFSVIFGVGIILFSLIESGAIKTTSQDTDASKEAWLKSLKVIPGSPAAKILSGEQANSVFTPDATTTTGILAQTTFLNTMMYQASNDSTVIDDQDAEDLVNTILNKTADQNPVRTYTKTDLTIVPTSDDTYKAYRSQLQNAFIPLHVNDFGNELLFVNQAMSSKNPKVLEPLQASVTTYQTLIKTLVSMKTPTVMADFQVILIQGYALILSGTQDMQKVLIDPAQGMLGINKYNTGMELITRLNDALAKSQ